MNRRKKLEAGLNKLENDYKGGYESVRDKLAAHRQKEIIDNLLDNWNDVDLLSIDIFVDDMDKILRKGFGLYC